MMEIVKFRDFDNIEYRKGSLKYSNVLMKLVEFLRLYRDNENELSFNIDEFESSSNIDIDEIIEMEEDDEAKNLYDITITIDNKNNKVVFGNLNNKKSRYFEDFNPR